MNRIHTRGLGGIEVAAALAALTALLVLAGCGAGGGEGPPMPHGPDLTAVPDGVRWVDYRGVSVPVGSDGPDEFTAQAATGFVQNPQGAALAAIVHTVRMSLAPDEHWASIAAHEIAAGDGKDAWVSSRVLLSIQTPADPATAPRLRGYTIIDYGSERSRVDIYTSFPDGSVAVNTATVVWVAGDWRLQLPGPDEDDPVVREAGSVEASVRLEAPL
ncbi:hypothetical protein [Nocardia sp. CNY236]|uniref:hypothetical protein n=1 Tax=Nocardia sp. CNY236 TaxID=1169152 RepID=UPI00041C6D22|nr:hypothetical protein [Nocardia sp. CNY236]